MTTRESFAMRSTQPKDLAELLAKKAVLRGIKWLDRHARPGWYRNMFEPRNGRFVFRAQISYDMGTILALAFEERKDLIDQFGYVNHHLVAKHFGLSPRAQQLLGLDCEYIALQKPTSPTRQMLEKSWEHTLSNFDRDSLAIRYRTPKEETQLARVKNFDFGDTTPRPRTFFEKIHFYLKRNPPQTT